MKNPASPQPTGLVSTNGVAAIQAATVVRFNRLYDQTTPSMPNMIDDMTRVEGTGTQ